VKSRCPDARPLEGVEILLDNAHEGRYLNRFNDFVPASRASGRSIHGGTRIRVDDGRRLTISSSYSDSIEYHDSEIHEVTMLWSGRGHTVGVGEGMVVQDDKQCCVVFGFFCSNLMTGHRRLICHRDIVNFFLLSSSPRSHRYILLSTYHLSFASIPAFGSPAVCCNLLLCQAPQISAPQQCSNLVMPLAEYCDFFPLQHLDRCDCSESFIRSQMRRRPRPALRSA
jgi:hypothetical protein